MAPAWHCSGGRNGPLPPGLQARYLRYPRASLGSTAQPGHRALCMGKCHLRKPPAKQAGRETATLACALQGDSSLLGLRA